MEELINTLKKSSWMGWEKSLIEIRKSDPEYEQAMDRVIEFEKRYEEMELSAENKADIGALMNSLDDVEESQAKLAYLTNWRTAC